jgi:8-oxo-dGTP diphosphatase
MSQRATAIIFRDGKFLLVRGKGKIRFSLPGGKINEGEPVISAVAREVYEELGLEAIVVKRLPECDFADLGEHKVCLVEIAGEPVIAEHELDEYIWWDMKQEIPVNEHVIQIIKKFRDFEESE